MGDGEGLRTPLSPSHAQHPSPVSRSALLGTQHGAQPQQHALPSDSEAVLGPDVLAQVVLPPMPDGRVWYTKLDGTLSLVTRDIRAAAIRNLAAQGIRPAPQQDDLGCVRVNCNRAQLTVIYELPKGVRAPPNE